MAVVAVGVVAVEAVALTRVSDNPFARISRFGVGFASPKHLKWSSDLRGPDFLAVDEEILDAVLQVTVDGDDFFITP